MSKLQLLAAALVLSAVSLALGWAARADRSPSAPAAAVTMTTAPAPAGDEALALELASVERRVAAVETRPIAIAAEPPPAPEAPVDHATAVQRAVERSQGYDRAFQAEPRDAAWAAQMEPLVQQAFVAGGFAGSRVVAMGCKTTFCRMEVEHDDAGAEGAIEGLIHEVPGNGFMQHMPEDTDGRSRTVVYFLRKERQAENVIYQATHRPKQPQ